MPGIHFCKFLKYKYLQSRKCEFLTDSSSIPPPPQKGMQLVALATGCFWLPAAAKLAWMTLEDENSQLARRADSCILCFAGPLAKGCRRAKPDEIPGEKEIRSFCH